VKLPVSGPYPFSGGKMKKNAIENGLKKAAFLFSFILLLVMPPVVKAQTVLRMAYPNFPPFHWADENGEMRGFFYEIITEAIEKRMGLKVIWTAYPWPRCQENIKAGKEDAILTVPTEERAAYTVTHEDPFYEKTLHLFTYMDHPKMAEIEKIKKIKDLKKGNFSVITYIGNGWHQEHVASLGIKTYETAYLKNVWKMLSEKRGDTVIEWPPGAWPDIRRVGVSANIVDTNIILGKMPFHVLVRKSSSWVTLLSDFNRTIKEMKKDGTLPSILLKYH
jgi:polar amino acid transport system substrate-binding protein